MTKLAGPSIYIPTDKNIYDALKHKKVTQTELVVFLRRRGIIVSRTANKDELVEKISSLTLEYADFNWLGKLLENPNRKDKTTHTQLKGELSLEQINKACQTVKSNISANEGDSVKVSKVGGTTSLTVTYVDVDFTKTEMRQRTLKTCEIALEQSDNGVVMKMPSIKKAKEIAEQISAALSAQAPEDKPFEVVNIGLEGIPEPERRSAFFDFLIRNIEGYRFDTVTSVNVYHFVEELDEDDGPSEARLASYINKAALAGEGVLDSQEFNQLHTRGFYIYRIIWTTESKLPDGEKVEFEAQFGAPDTCTEFKYTTRGIYNYNERTGMHNVSRRATTPRENNAYDLLLRDASERALANVKVNNGS
jgi:hypothetical protein